jgi:hypothetical protein
MLAAACKIALIRTTAPAALLPQPARADKSVNADREVQRRADPKVQRS